VKTIKAKTNGSKTNGQDCQATENSKLYESKGRKAMDLNSEVREKEAALKWAADVSGREESRLPEGPEPEERG
jgi:hypothetical protein